MKMLLDQNWKDSLIAICPLDDADEPEEKTAEESEDAPDEPETVIDNSLDKNKLPAIAPAFCMGDSKRELLRKAELRVLRFMDPEAESPEHPDYL